MHPTAERFQERLQRLGVDAEVRELADSTRTAREAADAVGVEVGQIVKSLVFVDEESPLLCLCAGDRRVETEKLGPGVRQAKRDEVRDATGFAIGGDRRSAMSDPCARSSTRPYDGSKRCGAPAAHPTRSSQLPQKR